MKPKYWKTLRQRDRDNHTFRNFFVLVLLSCIIGVLSGCTSNIGASSAGSAISRGTTQQEVFNKLGPPKEWVINYNDQRAPRIVMDQGYIKSHVLSAQPPSENWRWNYANGQSVIFDNGEVSYTDSK